MSAVPARILDIDVAYSWMGMEIISSNGGSCIVSRIDFGLTKEYGLKIPSHRCYMLSIKALLEQTMAS